MDALRDDCAFRSCVRAFDRVLGAGLQGLGWASVLALGRASSALVRAVEVAFVWAFASGCVPVLEGAFGVVAPRVPVSGGAVVACGPILEGPCGFGPAPAPGCGHGLGWVGAPGLACAPLLGVVAGAPVLVGAVVGPCAHMPVWAVPACGFGPAPALGCGHGLGCAGAPGPACTLGCDEGCHAPACGFGPVLAPGCGHGLGCAGAPGLACAPLLGVVAGAPVLVGAVVGPCAHMPVWAVPACGFGPVPALGCGHGLGCAGAPGPACALGCDEGCQAPACAFGPAPAPRCGHGLGCAGVPGPACAPLPGVVAGAPVLGVVVGPCAHMPVWAVPACAPGWAGVPWTPVPNCAVGVHMGPWAVGASCPALGCPIGACGAAPAWAGVGVGFCRGFISVMQCVQNVAPSSN